MSFLTEYVNLSSWQWTLLAVSFVSSAIVSERTLARMKRDAISEIMVTHRDAGWCPKCLTREKRRLEKLGFSAVETERIRLGK